MSAIVGRVWSSSPLRTSVAAAARRCLATAAPSSSSAVTPASSVAAGAAAQPAVVTVPGKLAKIAPEAPKQVFKQAPNREGVWTASQRERTDAFAHPRFEQVDLAAQPQPKAAIELIAEAPIVHVESRLAVCNGGHGALGHPRVYINLDQPGPHACGYCGIRFEQSHHH